jgi:hypothetical protein
MESNITLADITLMVSIIDACSERGSFKGNELVVVGTLRQKLEQFVKTNQPTETVEEGSAE